MILRGILLVWIAACIVLAFVWAPLVPVLEDTTRVLYFHIPSAWVTVLALGWSMVASVLYLFTSTKALDLLLLRHPIRQLDSASVLAYSQVALELSGHANAHSHMVSSADEGGRELTKALAYIRGKPSMVIPMGTPRPREWSVSFGRVEPGYERTWAYFTEIWVEPTGNVTVITDSLVSPLPIH